MTAYDRSYRQANLDKLRAYDVARNQQPGRSYATLSDEQQARRRESARRYQAAHPEAVKESKQRGRLANPETGRRYNRQYRQANLEQRREADRQRYWAWKAAVLAHYGEQCACCGATERLSIDHVDGDGAAHRHEIFGHNRGGSMYRWLVSQNFPSGLQTLCTPCNQSKKNGDRCRLEH